MNKKIGVYRLLSMKYQNQVTAKRQQLISRIALANPFYSFMSDSHLFTLLNEVSNFFHLTDIEICFLAILLNRFKSFYSFTHEEILYIIAYIAKANFSSRMKTYEEELKIRFPNFLLKYSNFINANFINQGLSTAEISRKYKELSEEIVVSQRKIDELNDNLNAIMVTGYKRKPKSFNEKDELEVGAHLKKIKFEFFGENFDDLDS
ncbi:unnamed protein product [Blepharisma stoltei]|uniref:Uncharacterized protein n=1 Tax=Blepharisma stoltei TaxID=1481888 RepID=A0AAU9IHG5_9CILI|nr:unnamed protein product [Blepharisma stoltei]